MPDEGLEASQHLRCMSYDLSLVLMVLGLLAWCCQSHSFKANHLCCALALLKDEEQAVRNLPTWVHFPDIERGEWLNKTEKHMWAFICQFTELFRETTELALQGANASPQHLQLHQSKRGSSTP
ncbi:Extended synaptotagmin-2 [Microtus ochrogaster]|uniref:Extended synaptotagmin-2 n=1 Tax=Microtus ochrogaster TaxID=79684 RepID=A0A8J6L4J9_MICOH|nr:Extended synaptotagmin-2 [Microtus ochrogaster]